MAFWGVEVKPGKPFTHKFDEVKGRLHISMATLGFSSDTTKSILQCNIGNKSPVYLCSLYPVSNESLQLNLEFEEAEDVILSVIGPCSIHLSGYFLRGRNSVINDDETESCGEDIANTETERSLCSDEDDYDDSFIDDDELEVFLPSPISFGEEKVSTHKKTKKKKGSSRRLVRKSHVIESEDEGCPEQKMAVNDNKDERIEESYEDRCAISSLCKNRLDAKGSQLELGDKDDKGNNGNDSTDKAVESKSKFAQPNSNECNTLSDVQEERETEARHIISFPLEGNSFENGEKTMDKKEEWKVVEKILHEINSDPRNVIEMVTAKEDDANAKDLVNVNVMPGENEHNQNNVELQGIHSVPSAEMHLQMKRNTKKKTKEHRKTTPGLEGDAADDKAVGTADKSQENVAMTDNIAFNLNEDYDGSKKTINEKDVMGSQMKENTKKNKKRKELENSFASFGGDVCAVDKSKENGANVDDVVVNPAEDSEEKQKAIDIKKVDAGDLPLSDGKTSDSKESKKKKKKRKTMENVENNVDKDIPDPSAELKAISMEEDENKVADAGYSKVGASLSGLVIEEIKAGELNNKIAESGKKISIYYTGRLESSGVLFDSNVGHAPYKFRLGRNKVIKGWDAGIEGMRVGEKRRLTVPPSMGFGPEGDGESLPPNAWLVYEIELVKVH